MSSKRASLGRVRLATGYQLWRLNQLGLLDLGGVREITAEQAG